MMRSEFQELLEDCVSDSEWEIVNVVYSWHPAIHDVGGKKEIVKLWLAGVVMDMYPRAERLMILDVSQNRHDAVIERLGVDLEKAIADLRAVHDESVAREREYIAENAAEILLINDLKSRPF